MIYSSIRIEPKIYTMDSSIIFDELFDSVNEVLKTEEKKGNNDKSNSNNKKQQEKTY